MTDKKLFNYEDVAGRIAAPLEGMDDEYVEIIRAHHTDYLNPKYSDEAKRESRREALNAARDLVALRCDKALAACHNIREEYSAGPAKAQKSDAARLADLTLWTATFKTKSFNELKAVWADRMGDEDLAEILTAELRGRDKTPAIMQLLQEIENGGPTVSFPDLDRVEKALRFFKSTAKNGSYPQGMAEASKTRFFDTPKQRTVSKDLDSFPVDGQVFRPVFRLSVLA